MANLKNFQKKLASAVTKHGIKKLVAEKLTKQAMKQVMKTVLADYGTALVENAVGAAINEFLVKRGSDMKSFDFTSIDPTGISGAVKSAVDGESALTQVSCTRLASARRGTHKTQPPIVPCLCLALMG